MGDALLFGGSSGGGIRNKAITRSGYDALSEEERNNPYIIWVIKNDDGTDFVTKDGTVSVLKAIHWKAYCELSDGDKMNPNTVWIIVDLTEEEYARTNIDGNNGSRVYTAGGAATLPERIQGIDYNLNRDSYNPVANSVVTAEIDKLNNRLGGLSFGVSETGGLRIEYDDGLLNRKE